MPGPAAFAPAGAAPAPSGGVVAAIAHAARSSGVDFSYLLAQARLESGLNPDARARTSTATGLYQFIDQSWLGVVDRHGAAHGLGAAADAITRGPDGRFRVSDPGARSAILALRRDPAIAARMAAAHASDNRAFLESRSGRSAGPVDLYLAHFLGPAGAVRFIAAERANPHASAAGVFPAAAGANRSIFYPRGGAPRSLAEVRQVFAARMARAGADAAIITSPGTPEPGAAPQREVQPADWLRIARSAASAANAARSASGAAPGLAKSAAPPPVELPALPLSASPHALASMLTPDPAQARLAFLLLSGISA